MTAHTSGWQVTADLVVTLADFEDHLGFTFPCQTWVATATR